MNALGTTRSTYQQYNLALGRMCLKVREKFRSTAAPEFFELLGDFARDA